MKDVLRVISPVDGRLYAERPLAGRAEIMGRLERARGAQEGWRHFSLEERARILEAFVGAFLDRSREIAEEITWQMGRPIAHSPREIANFAERARQLIAIGREALADSELGGEPGLRRFVRREPLGVVLVVAAWNLPVLSPAASVVPALLAGNAVILKHSSRTPLVAERFAEAFAAAGLPDNVFQAVHMDHALVGAAIRSEYVDHVVFTGSSRGGRDIQAAAAPRFLAPCLDLGGKDPAYVRGDADLDFAVAQLAEGVFFNAGQTCCGKERIYVHEAVHDRFLDAFAAAARARRLGDPTDPATDLGPVIDDEAADRVRRQVAAALKAGARALVDPNSFPMARADTPYLEPQVLAEVDHRMDVMTEETFGPVVGIMKVKSDAEAVRLMNDSPYGRSASIWTADADAALSIGNEVATGTWFMNRCNHLDPCLAWTGIRDSGRGSVLGRAGYEQLTRPKSFHFDLGAAT